MLRQHLQETFGREVLFLHGAVPKKQRDVMVERFQDVRTNGAGPPIFILSLKAGGTGLNLDGGQPCLSFRPLVEPGRGEPGHRPRLPDRPEARVQVHKFVCAGTLEEKIDEMIEQKQKVAGATVGSGEDWLTKL